MEDSENVKRIKESENYTDKQKRNGIVFVECMETIVNVFKKYRKK